MATRVIVFPGEAILSDNLPHPTNPSAPLKLGPGLRHALLSSITPSVAGILNVDHKKNAIWVENDTGRYIPQPQDLVLATVHHSSTDVFHCALTPHTPLAQLPHLAFENVSKKTRPQLAPGSLIYAKITAASKYTDAEISCVNVSTGKSEGMGELKGGMIFDVSLGMARRLLLPKQGGGVVLLEEIAEKMAFEVAVGRNGRIWVNAGGVKEVLAVGNAIKETDEKKLDVEEQKKLVKKVLKDLQT